MKKIIFAVAALFISASSWADVTLTFVRPVSSIDTNATLEVHSQGKECILTSRGFAKTTTCSLIFSAGPNTLTVTDGDDTYTLSGEFADGKTYTFYAALPATHEYHLWKHVELALPGLKETTTNPQRMMALVLAKVK